MKTLVTRIPWKIAPFILILAFGLVYMRHTWKRIEQDANENILQVATSIEASLPKDGLATLRGSEDDLYNDSYLNLKQILQHVITVNDKARFAYLYTRKGNNIIFMVDSEPATSEDYSPPGQVFTEATATDWLPLNKGQKLVTTPITDRWGTWVSTLIPVKDPKTGKVLAVFGMDFNAKSYKSMILVEEMRSSLIILLLLILLLFIFRIRKNNDSLKQEILIREEAEKTIQQQNQELLQLNNTKDKFFSIIAHDLRGPFAGFLGLTEMLAQTLHSMTLEEIQQFASSMEKSSKNLYRLLENLLQWALLQRNVMSFKPESISLQEQVDEVTTIVNETYNSKQIRILHDIPEGLKIFADIPMVNAIMRNILSNACKYSSRGGDVTISARKTGENKVTISISDTGIGIPPEIAANLFKLDVVTGRKGTEGEPSTGLGLILCRDFVQKHGGKIWVESKEGNGSTFHFTLDEHSENSAIGHLAA